jgi:hypothetical protein
MSWMQTIAGVESSPDVMSPIQQRGDKWYVPETFTAGNKWSKGQVNSDWAKSFGGTYSGPTTSQVMGGTETYNPYNPNANRMVSTTTPGGWTFSQDPTQYIANGQGASFIPGQGESKLKSAAKSVAPIL